MATFISHSAADTEALGEQWGRAAARGWVVALCGDLGAGKTQLVRGLARGLDLADRVHSPSFALVHHYTHGPMPLFHLDLYRLETAEELVAAGLEEFLQPAGVTAIEWADRWPGLETRLRARWDARAGGGLWVRITPLAPTVRQIEYEPVGA